MNKNLFTGTLVRLAAPNAATDAETLAQWSRDAEYLRLLDSTPARSWLAAETKEQMEKWEGRPDALTFMIRTLSDDRLIGFIELDGIQWTNGDSFVGIGIGDRDYWGKGYGTDAMRVMERYAFTELNLHRLSLNVFGYNTRALRSYEKAGFTVEGRIREPLNRDGRRWDLIFMGILKSEWEKQRP